MANETKRRLLLSKWRDQDVRDELDKAEETISNQAWQIEDMESTLLDVRYWLHDGLVFHRLVSDPRALLRKVEDAIG
jgi:hypothetical protein